MLTFFQSNDKYDYSGEKFHEGKTKIPIDELE